MRLRHLIASSLALTCTIGHGHAQAPEPAVEPGFGRVEFEFVTPEGDRLPGVRRGEMRPVGGESIEFQSRDGIAVVERVPVGSTLAVSVREFPEGVRVDPRVRFEGPSAAGETRCHRVALIVQRPIVVVELRTRDGARLSAGDRVCVQRIAFLDGRRKRGGWTTDSVLHDGTVCFSLAPDWRLLALRFVVRDRVGRVIGAAECAYDRVYSNRVHRLDPMRLEPATRIAHGRVIDDAGRPIRDAWVELHPTSKDEIDIRNRRDEELYAPKLVSVFNYHWQRYGLYNATVDANGRYAIWGLPVRGGFRLRARSRTFPAAERAPDAIGATDIQVHRFGEITGRVLLDDGLDATDFAICVQVAGGERIGRWRRDGTFRCGRLPDGPATLTVRYAYGVEAVLFSRSFTVTTDPIAPIDIDLRGRIPPVTITVTGNGNQPLEGASVWPKGRGSPYETDARGKVALPRVLAVDVRIDAPAHNAALIRGAAPVDVTIPLDPHPAR